MPSRMCKKHVAMCILCESLQKRALIIKEIGSPILFIPIKFFIHSALSWHSGLMNRTWEIKVMHKFSTEFLIWYTSSGWSSISGPRSVILVILESSHHRKHPFTSNQNRHCEFIYFPNFYVILLPRLPTIAFQKALSPIAPFHTALLLMKELNSQPNMYGHGHMLMKLTGFSMFSFFFIHLLWQKRAAY